MFDDARRASSNHLLPSRKFERGRAGKEFQGAFQQVSLRRGRRACAQKVCQLFEPAQNACAECPRCDRVTGELRSRLAAEISLLINHALNVGMPSSREAVVQLASSRACRRTGQKAGGSCGRGDCSAVRLHESRVVACSMLVVHHRVLSTYRLCGHLWLMERAKRGRDVPWGKAPLHPS